MHNIIALTVAATREDQAKMSGRRRTVLLSSALLLAGVSLALPLRATAADKHEVDRGKYLVTIGSCTDCHTRVISSASPT